MDTGLHDTAARIMSATTPEDLFGLLTGDAQSRVDALERAYKTLARTVHPDLYATSTTDTATAREAFVRLGQLKTDAVTKCRDKTYGDRKPVVRDQPVMDPLTVKIKNRTFNVTRRLYQGDFCDLYECTYDDGKGPTQALFKITGTTACNDLVEHEAQVLAKLYPASQPEVKDYRYLPRLHDSFTLRGHGGARRVNVIQRFTEPLVSFAEVMRAYPTGLDFRDWVWMFKRNLAALGFVHRQGFVHGAVVPSHVLVDPVGHGARLIDWSYAVPPGERVKAVSVPARDYYAPEILTKQPAGPATDIYMAVKCAVALLGGNVVTGEVPTTVPAPIRGFLTACLFADPRKRPSDAWELHVELDQLLEKLVGKPKYRLFKMPG